MKNINIWTSSTYRHLFLMMILIGCFTLKGFNQLPDSAVTKIHIYLLAGQSNMAGRGDIEPADTFTQPRIYMMNKAGKWVPGREPLAFDKPVAGVGPGFSFAKKMALHDSTTIIAIVPCAVGGTKIDCWKPGGYDSVTHTFPYDDALKRISLAKQYGIVKAVLWHQGESDAKKHLSNKYEVKLKALITGIRADLQMPGLPFIAGLLGDFLTAENADAVIVNNAILKVSSTTPHCGVVNVKGLVHKGDGLHFNAQSARDLGERYAMCLIKIR